MPKALDTKSAGDRIVPRWLRNLLIGVVVLILLIGLPWSILETTSRIALKRQIAEMRAAGQPLSLEEYYERLPALPNEENSALIIESLREELNAIASLKPRPEHLPYFGKAELPVWAEPWPRATLDAISEFAAASIDLVERLDPIRELPRGRFDIELTPNPLDVHVSHLRIVGAAGKLEALAAIRDALAGDHDRAIDRCRTMFCIASSVWDEPTLYSSFVSSSTDALAAATIERVLMFGSADPERLAALQARMKEREAHHAIPDGIRGERLFEMGIHEYVRRNGLVSLTSISNANIPIVVPKVFNWLIGGLIRTNQAKMMELMAPLIEALDSLSRAREAAAVMDRRARALGPQYTVAKLLLPSLTRSVTLWARQLAALRCARVGLAAERYRIAHGEWPKSLDTLVPDYMEAVPLDPFDEKPLRYRVDADRITVYSVHENETDDGGIIDDDPPAGTASPDIGFRLLNPELRGLRIEEASGLGKEENAAAGSDQLDTSGATQR